MATFNDLPNEIIEIIFLYCLPILFDVEGRSSIDDYHTHRFADYDILLHSDEVQDGGFFTPSIFAAVCRRWMEITLNSPRLWTQLDMDARAFSNRQDILSTTLQRSKPMPLQIRLKLIRYSTSSELTEAECKPIIDMLRMEYKRLQRFSIFMKGVDPNILTTFFFPLGQPTQLPLLEDFVATVEGRWYVSPYRTLLGKIDAPRLRSFMVGINLDYLWELLSPPSTANLSRLQIDFREHPSIEALEQLSRCRNLEAFVWAENGWGVPRNMPFDCDFVRLQKLTLTLTDLTQYSTVTERFHTPQLRTLAIVGHYDVPFTWSTQLLKKNPLLKELRIISLGLKEGARDIFAYLPNLETLVLGYCYPSEAFLSSLLPTTMDGSPIVLPKLRTMVFGKSAVGFMYPMTADVIEARNRPNADGERPRFLVVTEGIQLDLFQRLERLRMSYPDVVFLESSSSSEALTLT